MTTAPRRLKPAYWLAAAFTMIVAGLLLVRPASAGNPDNPLASVPFELRLDLAKAYQSPVGSTIMNYVRQAKPNADELMDGLVDTLGLDPRTAVSTLVLSGTFVLSVEEDANEYDLQLIADLGDSTGKLEGWMLGLPGYASEDIDKQTLLHSFFMNESSVETSGNRAALAALRRAAMERHVLSERRDLLRQQDSEANREVIETLTDQIERFDSKIEERQAGLSDGIGDLFDLESERAELKRQLDVMEDAVDSDDARKDPRHDKVVREMRDGIREELKVVEREIVSLEAQLGDDGDLDEALRVFIALPESNGRFTLVASLDSKTTTDLAQTIRGGEAILDDADALQGDQIMRLTLDDLSNHNLPKNVPGSAVLESIAGLTLTLGSGDNVTANMVMNTATPARARQVTQLLQGLVALTQLAALEQPEMQQLANLLGDVKIAQLNGEATSSGPGVTASFSGSHAEFEKWVDWFAQQAK